MNNQLTFNSNSSAHPSQFPSLSKQQQETTRFNDPYENKQLPQQPQHSQQPSVIRSQQLGKSDTGVKTKSKSGEYLSVSCPEHPDREGENVCLKVGCPRVNPILCSECMENHYCDNITSYQSFVSQANFKLDSQSSYIDVDSQKMEILKNLQQLQQQLLSKFQQSIQMLEPFMLKRIIVDESQNLEMKASHIQSILRTDLTKLNQKRDYQQLTQDESTLIKLLINDFVSIQDIQKTFVSDREKIRRKQDELRNELLNQLTQFFQQLEDELSGTLTEQLKKLDISPQQQRDQIEKQILSAKPALTLMSHKTPVVDFCQISQQLVGSVSGNGQIIIWKLPFYRSVCEFQHGIECTSITSCQDELRQRFLVSSGRTNVEYQIYLWNIDLRTKVVEVIGHNHALRKVIPLSNSRLAWCSQDHCVRVWNLRERQQDKELTYHTAWINDLCKLSEQLVASCSRDQTVAVVTRNDLRQFNIDTYKLQYQIKSESYVTCLSAVTNETFAYGNFNGYLRIYQNEKPNKLYEFRVNSSWLDNNGIWCITKITSTLLAISSATGKINFIGLDQRKEPNLREIEMTSQAKKQSETMLWVSGFQQLLISAGSQVKIFS